MAVDIRDQVVLPGVKPGVQARDVVIGHNRLLLCELTGTAASGPHCRRAERPVSTGIEPWRRVRDRGKLGGRCREGI